MSRRFAVDLYDELGHARSDEPVAVPLAALGADVGESDLVVVDESGDESPAQRVKDPGATLGTGPCLVFLASTSPGEHRRYFISQRSEAYAGPSIQSLQPEQDDGFRRLDTGTYTVELCVGLARGGTAGKWGIRHFADNHEGRSLIRDYGNAIGGVFGPYFTPENGWINPPEHARATATVLEEGPVLCRYRFDVDVPVGTDRSLDGSRIQIDWSFYLRARLFDRTYSVTPFETVIDKRPAANKLTVGDEFEWGPGTVVFSRFEASPQTVYRAGDPHSMVLIDEIGKALADIGPESSSVLRRYAERLRSGIDGGSYDWYWRLFSAHEPLLEERVRRPTVDRIIERAHRDVAADLRSQPLTVGGVVDVTRARDETIFVRNASKTAEINPESGHTFVWYTTRPVRRYQIVQRPQSGWVNWGTNGENEYPELPSGTSIRSSYGQFADWPTEAAKLESPLIVDTIGWEQA